MTERQEKMVTTLDEIIECAVRWTSEDADNPDTPCEDWQEAFRLIKAAPVLLLLAVKNLDPFTLSYIITALHHVIEGQVLPVTRLATGTLVEMLVDCWKFQQDNAELIGTEYASAGHSFWFARHQQRPDSGYFWQRWPTHADALNAAAVAYKPHNLYVGDDGQVHLEAEKTDD